MSDLEQILSGEQSEPVAEVQPEPQAEVEVEVETVEEAPVEAAPEPEKAEVKQAEPTMVPVGVVQELRRKLQQMESERTQQAPNAVPDVFDDPQGYQAHMQQSVQQGITGSTLKLSRFMAEREFGKETVDAAYEYFEQHPDQSTALLNEASPFHTAVEIYNRQQVAQEIGSDPAAYRAKLEAEIRAEYEAEMVTKQARDKAGQFAPSMANVTGTGGGPKTTWTGPTSLNSVIGS